MSEKDKHSYVLGIRTIISTRCKVRNNLRNIASYFLDLFICFIELNLAATSIPDQLSSKQIPQIKIDKLPSSVLVYYRTTELFRTVIT